MVNQRQTFLDAIIANPDDDAIRLVYADWLEEHGTAVDRERAHFIRIQIELQRVEDEDRGKVILTECSQLMDRHWQEWTFGFQAEKTGADHYKAAFSRGFLTYLGLAEEEPWDPRLDALLAHEPVTHFAMMGDGSFAEAIAHWKHLPRVRELSFGNRIKNCKALLRSPLLTGVYILHGAAYLDEEDVTLIASDPRFANLRRLDISHNFHRGLGDSAVETVAFSRTLWRLTSFDYGGNSTTVSALEALAKSPLAKRLTYVGLPQFSWSHAPRIGKRGAELLTRFRCLEGIDLNRHQIGDQGAMELAHAATLGNLKQLNLSDNGLGQPGVTALLSSPYLTNLEELDLSSNEPGHDWISVLASAGPRRLSKLDLANNLLDGEAVALLANAEILEGVTDLSLRSNDIGDQGAVALAASTRLRQLFTLDLSYCEIGDKGAIALADSATLSWLEYTEGLDLSGNHYGKKAARRLQKRFHYDPSKK